MPRGTALLRPCMIRHPRVGCVTGMLAGAHVGSFPKDCLLSVSSGAVAFLQAPNEKHGEDGKNPRQP